MSSSSSGNKSAALNNKPDIFPEARMSHREYGWDFWNNKKMYDLYVSHFGNINSLSVVCAGRITQFA